MSSKTWPSTGDYLSPEFHHGTFITFISGIRAYIRDSSRVYCGFSENFALHTDSNKKLAEHDIGAIGFLKLRSGADYGLSGCTTGGFHGSPLNGSHSGVTHLSLAVTETIYRSLICYNASFLAE